MEPAGISDKILRKGVTPRKPAKKNFKPRLSLADFFKIYSRGNPKIHQN